MCFLMFMIAAAVILQESDCFCIIIVLQKCQKITILCIPTEQYAKFHYLLTGQAVI